MLFDAFLFRPTDVARSEQALHAHGKFDSRARVIRVANCAMPAPLKLPTLAWDICCCFVLADNSAVDRDNPLSADHAIVVSKPSIRYAERSWRAFRLLLWRRCRRCARRLSAEPWVLPR
jgi:hypothetical protein